MPRRPSNLAPFHLLAAVYLGIPALFYAAIYLAFRALT
jgi:hypothetical protein